jgi:sugar (pentulose or hexulose) kinase
VQDATVVAAGGPLENVPLWGRMVSDTLGRSVQLVDALEVTSRGVAVLICESLTGVVPTVGVKRTIVPEKEAHAAYAKALARNNELYDQMYAKL